MIILQTSDAALEKAAAHLENLMWAIIIIGTLALIYYITREIVWWVWKSRYYKDRQANAKILIEMAKKMGIYDETIKKIYKDF